MVLSSFEINSQLKVPPFKIINRNITQTALMSLYDDAPYITNIDKAKNSFRVVKKTKRQIIKLNKVRHAVTVRM